MRLHPVCEQGFETEMKKLALPWAQLFNAGMRGAGRMAGRLGARLAPAFNTAKGVGQEFAATYPRGAKALRWAGGQALQGAGFSAAMVPFMRRPEVTEILPEGQRKMGEAYQETMEALFKEAEAKGFSDPQLSPERRAWYLDFEKQAGDEALQLLDEETLDQMNLVEKVAHYAGFGKLAGPALNVLRAGVANAAKAVASSPSRGLMAAFLKKSPQLGEGGVKKLLGERAEMMAKDGPMAWTRLRKGIGRPGSGPLATPHPAGTGGTLGRFAPPHSLRREFLTGAAFGGGFGMLQRMSAPKEEPEIRMGNY